MPWILFPNLSKRYSRLPLSRYSRPAGNTNNHKLSSRRDNCWILRWLCRCLRLRMMEWDPQENFPNRSMYSCHSQLFYIYHEAFELLLFSLPSSKLGLIYSSSYKPVTNAVKQVVKIIAVLAIIEIFAQTILHTSRTDPGRESKQRIRVINVENTLGIYTSAYLNHSLKLALEAYCSSLLQC